MWINKRPHLSPIVYDSLQIFTYFKEDMHNVYIRVQKDPEKKWAKLPFIMIDENVFVMLDSWTPEWCASDLAVHDEMTIQGLKDASKLLAQQKENE